IEPSKGLVRFITEHPKSKLAVATTNHFPNVYIRFNKKFKQAQNKMDETVNLPDFISVKGIKAIGNRLSTYPILSVDLLEPDAEREQEANEAILATRPQTTTALNEDGTEAIQPSLF
ncbi:MAG: hypothetical protein RLZZ155_913, partial [Bacteroidota bacterium]